MTQYGCVGFLGFFHLSGAIFVHSLHIGMKTTDRCAGYVHGGHHRLG